MKRYFHRVLLGLVFLGFASTSHAFENIYNIFPGNSSVQYCYGMAMIGFDSVINSRIGVPPDELVVLARMNSLSPPGEHYYSTDLLGSMFNAYLWEGSPHSYAITVFYACAQRDPLIQSASSQEIDE